MTRKQIAELTIRALSGGVPNRDKYDVREVYLYLDIVVNQVMTQEITAALNSGSYNDIDSTWVRQYFNVPVKWNDSLEMCFIQLPATRLSLPMDYDIRQISWMKDQSSASVFFIMGHAAYPVISQLECADTGDSISCYPQNNTIYIPGSSQGLEGGKLLIKMIPASDGYTEDQDIPISSTFIADIVGRVATMMTGQAKMPQKVTNDNNPNTV